MKGARRIEVPISLEEMDEIRDGKKFFWIFDDIEVVVRLESDNEYDD